MQRFEAVKQHNIVYKLDVVKSKEAVVEHQCKEVGKW